MSGEISRFRTTVLVACAISWALGVGCSKSTGGGGGGGGGGSPSLPGTHPRIYLNDTVRTRLNSALVAEQQPAIRFRTMVDDKLGGTDIYGFEGWFAALLYQLTGDEAYGRFAVDEVESRVVQEEATIAAGERPDVAFDSYLYVGDLIGNLALVYDWCWDLLSSGQRTRWSSYANQAVWNVWHPDQATWGGRSYPWSGWSTHNPSNNYYYSFLRATMLLGLATHGEDPAAEDWMAYFRDTKIAGELVPAFQQDLIGGGSREGNGYGVSQRRLFELYDFWEQSTGERIHDLTPHARASLARYLHLTVPTFDWVAPVGDFARESTGAWFDYDRAYVEILAWLYRDDPLAGPARWFLRHGVDTQMASAFMYVYDFLYDDASAPETPLTELGRAYYASGIGQIYTRSSWDADATWLSLTAGPYTESHAHRDQGSLLLYRSEWLADDQNRRSHSGIHQDEEMHNLVRLEDAGGSTIPLQFDGASRLVTLADEPTYTYAAVEVTPMYTDSPSVTRVEREVVFVRPSVVVVFDRIDSATGTRHVWQLNSPIQPSLSGSIATLTGTTTSLRVQRLLPSAPNWTVVDWSAADTEMVGGGFRLDLADTPADGHSRFLQVLSVGNAVASVEAADTGTRRGALVHLSDGGSVTVRFEEGGWGGDIRVADSGGATVVDAALPTGVADLPLFE